MISSFHRHDFFTDGEPED